MLQHMLPIHFIKQVLPGRKVDNRYERSTATKKRQRRNIPLDPMLAKQHFLLSPHDQRHHGGHGLLIDVAPRPDRRI